MLSYNRKVLFNLSKLGHSVQFRNGTSIAVILTDDLQGRGVKGEEVEVKRGFARNFLIPRKKAVYATYANKLKHSALASSSYNKKDELMSKLRLYADDGVDLFVSANENGVLFAAVNVSEIKNVMSSKGIMLDNETRIVIETPIKTLGRHIVQIEEIDICFDVRNLADKADIA